MFGNCVMSRNCHQAYLLCNLVNETYTFLTKNIKCYKYNFLKLNAINHFKENHPFKNKNWKYGAYMSLYSFVTVSILYHFIFYHHDRIVFS